MTTVVTRLFDTYDHARQAVQDLEASGIPHSEISIVASNADSRHGDAAIQSSGQDIIYYGQQIGTGE